jgi:hypothetical protein
MKTASFGNFQVGMVDDPSVEDKGGFEFASGMDIFSEPGVMKAALAMEAVPLGTGVVLDALPTHLASSPLSFGSLAFIAKGDDVLKLGTSADSYITNGEGNIDGLATWAGYVLYSTATSTDLGRVPISSSNPAADKDDTYLSLSDAMSSDKRSFLIQAGSLKISSYRYVDLLNESFALKSQALKLTDAIQVTALANYQNSVFVGSRTPFNPAITSTRPNEASIFRWTGIPLSSGSALPNDSYPIERFGTFALPNDGANLYALVDDDYTLFLFDGALFRHWRKLQSGFISTLRANNESHCTYRNSFLFSGNSPLSPGIFRVQNGAVCQQFVPAGITPGSATAIEVGFVKVSIQGKIYFSYKNVTAGTFHLERESANRQNGAFASTVWHRMGTDRNKRWSGVKLNLEPLASGCSVAVHYRTSRNASFTDSGYTITSANQDKPVIFTAAPRSREIQFKFVYTTSGANTPELISYDPIFEVLNSMR